MHARASLLIRRPAQDCYSAFTEPDQLTKFWLSAASGPLTVGETVRWDFMVAGASIESRAAVLEPARRILIHWGESQVEWTFEESSGETVVTVEHRNLPEAELVASTEGFTTVLCDLKILLEGGSSPGLVRDKAELISRTS